MDPQGASSGRRCELDVLAKPEADPGRQVVADQTLALSFVFMHEELGLAS